MRTHTSFVCGFPMTLLWLLRLLPSVRIQTNMTCTRATIHLIWTADIFWAPYQGMFCVFWCWIIDSSVWRGDMRRAPLLKINSWIYCSVQQRKPANNAAAQKLSRRCASRARRHCRLSRSTEIRSSHLSGGCECSSVIGQLYMLLFCLSTVFYALYFLFLSIKCWTMTVPVCILHVCLSVCVCISILHTCESSIAF